MLAKYTIGREISNPKSVSPVNFMSFSARVALKFKSRCFYSQDFPKYFLGILVYALGLTVSTRVESGCKYSAKSYFNIDRSILYFLGS